MSSTMPKSHFWEVVIRTECFTWSINFFLQLHQFTFVCTEFPLSLCIPVILFNLARCILVCLVWPVYISHPVLWGLHFSPGLQNQRLLWFLQEKTPKGKGLLSFGVWYSKAWKWQNTQLPLNDSVVNRCFASHLPLQSTLANVYSPLYWA